MGNFQKPDGFTVVGTNIDEVKRNNENSGLTYNEVKELLAKTTGTRDEGSYSQTDIAAMKKIHD
ncbi:hypothetical protein [Paenisporosarcina indica]|uniref:hypothetical protein n=1 Tax=Paenisporosarcina indica TaxID=650093 RepID=UPI000950236F|nr:hypothetical protein [Paenisporosarcina indica]